MYDLIHGFFQTDAGDFLKDGAGCLFVWFGAMLVLSALAYLGMS